MSKPRKPRASKVEVYWQKKQAKPPVAKAKAKRRRAAMSMQPFKPSNHPVVNFLKEVENGTKLDPDVKTALLAGYQAGHCTPESFSMNHEIARVKTDTGVKRLYACDVCGFVGSKEFQS